VARKSRPRLAPKYSTELTFVVLHLTLPELLFESSARRRQRDDHARSSGKLRLRSRSPWLLEQDLHRAIFGGDDMAETIAFPASSTLKSF